MALVRHARPAVGAMYAGLALTLVSLVVIHVDRATANVLADHIRTGYPTYSQGSVDEAVMLWAVVLSVVGALGVLGWLTAIRVTRAGRPSARWLVPSLFTVGTGLALYLLVVRDTSGDTGLPPLLGGVGMLPSVAGLAAVILVRRASRHTTPQRTSA